MISIVIISTMITIMITIGTCRLMQMTGAAWAKAWADRHDKPEIWHQIVC